MRIALTFLLVLMLASCGGRETAENQMGIRGRVQSQEGQPIPNAYMTLVGKGVATHEVTDKKGRFFFATDSSDAYWVVAAAAGYQPFLVPVLVDGPVEADIQLQKDEMATDVDSLFINGELADFIAHGELSRASLNGAVTFDEPDGTGARIARIQRETETHRAAYAAAYSAYRDEGGDPNDFEYDWAPMWQQMREAIAAEQDSLARHYLQMNYFLLGYPEADTAAARQMLADVPPASRLWTLMWGDPLVTFATIAHIAEHPGLSSTYAFYGIDTNHDLTVKSAFLFYLLTEAEDQNDANLAGRFYSMLINEFPNSSYTALAKNLYDIGHDVAVGSPVPDFLFYALGDSSVVYTRDMLLGSIYVIDFWAVWCAPCVAEMRYLNDAYKKYGPQGFNILSVSFNESLDDMYRFQAELWPMPWLNTHIEEGFWSEAAEMFEITGIPKPILVDKAGIIIAMGFDLRGNNLDKTLARVFSQ